MPHRSQSSPDEDGAAQQELAELLADVQALLSWEELRGARLLPVEETPLASAGPAPGRASRPPPAAAPAPPEQPAQPAARVALEGRWAALAQQKVLSGVELQRALKASVLQADPVARLAHVRQTLGDCQRCGLCNARTKIVFGVGDPAARLLILGEGPGQQEDLAGEPFVGPAGAMLDGMLEGVLGLERDQVYILNLVKCHPPRSRDPSDDEIAACRPFLRAQLASIRPDLVLLLGDVASRSLLGQDITRARGQWHGLAWPGGGARVMATFHPAYLLGRPQDKRQTFGDLKLLRQALDQLPPRGPLPPRGAVSP